MSVFAWSEATRDQAAGAGIGGNQAECTQRSLCTLRLGSQTLGIDTRMVREVISLTDPLSRQKTESARQVRYDLRCVPLAPTYVAGIVAYRGEVLTTLSLRALLDCGPERSGGCVIVFDDEGTGERLGLIVDGVLGVTTVQEATWEPNACTLDSRSQAVLDGVYKMASGLIVRINPAGLSPIRLAATGLLGEKWVGGRAPCGL